MSPIKLYLFSICLCGFVILQASYVADGQIPPADGAVSKDKAKPADLIHFGDLIDVDVIGSTEFDWRGTLNPEGYLNGVDFVDEPIFALCRSEAAVAGDIVEGYKKILRDPQVAVKIVDRSGRAISYLYGAVKRPQRFRIERLVRLNELIIVSGGIDEKASGEIQILRSSTLNCEERERNGEISRRDLSAKIIKISISDLIKGANEANPVIVNGDIITVTEAEPIYVIGSVVNPRQINARSDMTLSRAIASAGGFTKNADTRNIIVFRRSKNETLRIELDFNKIESKEAEDLILQKYDIIEIAQNGVERRAFAPIVKVFENETKTFEMPLKIID
jgi:protein involved in polysaccharide export with SLBB domain